MNTRFILSLGLMLSTLALAGAEATPPAAAPRDAAVEKLVDDLVNVSSQMMGANNEGNSGMVSKFLGSDDPPLMFSSGMPSFVFLPTPPTIRKIVELGVAAVPSLLDHLSDARDTKLIILNPGIPTGSAGGMSMVRFGMIMWNDEYDPRYRGDRSRQPTTVNLYGQVPRGGGGPGDSYTVKVGDLCYVLLGQIVNRSLIAARYQGTGSAVINSPIQNPALADAARKDWAGLTVEQHRASLAADATGVAEKHFQFDHYWSQHADALARLAFYYPSAYKAAVLKDLAHPIADWHYKRTQDFTTQLLAEPDAAARTALLVSAQKQWGSSFVLTVADRLKEYTTEAPPTPTNVDTLPEGWTLQRNLLMHNVSNPQGAATITQVYPHPQWDWAKQAIQTVDDQGWNAALKGSVLAPIGEQTTLIKGLGKTSDPAIDAACMDLFRQALAAREPGSAADTGFDQLAIACLAQLQKNPTANQKFIDEYKADLAKLQNATVANPAP